MNAIDSGAPSPPPPPSPPPGAPPGEPGNPWERRNALGFLDGLVQAVRLFVTSPGAAYEQTLRRGDLVSPLIFAIVLSLIGFLLSEIWSLAFHSPFMWMMPPEAWEGMGFLAVGSAVGIMVQLVLAPIFVAVVLFIWSAIVHGCLLLVGGTGASDAGFEGTFRVLAYSTVSQLAQVVPIAGGLIGLVWGIVLGVIGLTVIHRTSQGKALVAILLPMLLCCICVAVAVMAMFGGLAAFIAASQR